MNNNNRYDLSDRIIHFFRQVDLAGDSPVHFPENWGLDHLVENHDFNPFFLLRAAVRKQRLFATWAVRNKKRTIYGKSPAICFTEMPLAAFIQTSRERSRLGQAISTYGISFLKTELFDIGARPVIYGLSVDDIRLVDSMSINRVIDVSLLPLNEQYRYVTYNPIHHIDWTHEREWRWAYPDSVEKFESKIEEYGIVAEVEEIPCLPLHDTFTELGVIVQTKNEAELVVCDILAEYDRCKCTPYKFVFYTDQISTINSLMTPQQEMIEINKNLIDLSEHTNPQSDRDDKMYKVFREIIIGIETKQTVIEEGEFGGCWLWLYDSMHEFTRALVNNERIVVNNQNKYLCFPFEFNDLRSLAQRESMIEELSNILRSEFNIDCGYFSVLGSDDYNQVPTYHSQNYDRYRDRFMNTAY